jgi:iron complex transport system substrate-binding protein
VRWRAGTGIGRLVATVVLAGAIAYAGETRAAPPQRVVSINLCADQLVMALAAPETIRSVSWVAADPALSNFAAEARRYPLNRGSLEEVIALRPDLVVSMAGRAGRMRFRLARLGIAYDELAPPDDVAGLRRMIRDLAARLGTPGRGRAVLVRLDRDWSALAAAPHRRRVLLYGPNGATFGRDTLPGAVMAQAGWANVADALGISAYGTVPLEGVALARPDLIAALDPGGGASLARRLIHHPILRQGSREVAVIPQRLVLCPGPWNLKLADRLDAAAAR